MVNNYKIIITDIVVRVNRIVEGDERRKIKNLKKMLLNDKILR